MASGSGVASVRAPPGVPSPSMKRSTTTASATSARRSKKLRGSAIGRSGDTVITTRTPGPGSVGVVLLAIGVRGVRPDLEEAAPRRAAGDPAVVLHVAADAAERPAERAAAVGLERVRADGPQEARGPREHARHPRFGQDQAHEPRIAITQGRRRAGARARRGRPA